MGTAVSLCLAVVIGAGAEAPPAREDAPTPTAGDVRPTAAFRLHHRKFHAELLHLDRLVARLPAQEETRRRETMGEVVSRLDQRLRAHARVEEEALYPAADARVGGTEPFTATLRREHRIFDRWLVELDRLARRDRPDPRVFARQANRLLGLVVAHFELEEEVLLPILDRTMTAREFQEEVADRMGPLHETLPVRPASTPAERPASTGPAPAADAPPPAPSP